MPANRHRSDAVFFRALICESLEELEEQTRRHEAPVTSIERLGFLLQTLQLDAAELGQNVNRLASVWRYFSCGEYGAARFELRVLRRRLEPSWKISATIDVTRKIAAFPGSSGVALRTGRFQS